MSCGRRGARQLALWGVFYKVTHPVRNAPSSWPHYLPKAPPPDTVTAGVRISILEFGWGGVRPSGYCRGPEPMSPVPSGAPRQQRVKGKEAVTERPPRQRCSYSQQGAREGLCSGPSGKCSAPPSSWGPSASSSVTPSGSLSPSSSGGCLAKAGGPLMGIFLGMGAGEFSLSASAYTSGAQGTGGWRKGC